MTKSSCVTVMRFVAAICVSAYAVSPAASAQSWNTTGNAGTTPGANYLGTSDNKALEIKVNGSRALRVEPQAASPNLVGGYLGNSVTGGMYGSVIAGGGYSGWVNRVLGALGTVGGGAGNTAGALESTVAGGYRNTAFGTRSTVSGGVINSANGQYGVVAGGSRNTAQSDYGTVSGGLANTALGQSSVVAGGGGDPSDGAGGTNTANTATDNWCTVGGGQANRAGNGGAYDDAPFATVSGGKNNIASGARSTVGGGEYNQALGNYATIAGGGPAGGIFVNDATDDYTTIGGGAANVAGNLNEDTTDATYATVGGGESNSATFEYATIGGGEANAALGKFAIIGGGYYNYVFDDYGTVGGGTSNFAGSNDSNSGTATAATVAGGSGNQATATVSTVSGGRLNAATGYAAMVPGGLQNEASGNYSFAAGDNAHATAAGAFAWADIGASPFTVSTANRFGVRASGGVFLYTNSAATSGVYVNGGSGTWNSVSDRNAKENFQTVNPQAVLERVAAMPITTWNYKAEGAGVRHIGPMAQDMYAAFTLGDSDKAIGTVDADGIALASIQALNHRSQCEFARVAALESQVRDLQAANAALEKKLGEVETENREMGDVKARLAKLEQLTAAYPVVQVASAK